MGNRKVEVVRDVLLGLYETADHIGSQYHQLGKTYPQILAIRAVKERRRQMGLVMAMKRRNLIDTRKTAAGLEIALTAKGSMRAVREAVKGNRTKLPTGQSCMVLFDIPESASASRNAFRYFLKDAGFKMVQLSVWESPFDVFRDVLNFVTAAAIDKWVTVVDARVRT